MIVSLALALDLARICAPSVAPATILAIAHAESSFDTLAINVNGGPRVAPMRDIAAASSAARQYIAAGYSVDLGLGQINSSNLARLGLSIEDSFDPCRNLAASARVIGDNYRASISAGAVGHDAMGMALSLYNTGKPRRGFANGYVARVYRSAAILANQQGMAEPADAVSMARNGSNGTSIQPNTTASPVMPDPRPMAQAAAWDVFARPAPVSLIFRPAGDSPE